MLTEQQRQERNQGIGGSDIAIILGLSKYKTPYQLFLEKKGLSAKQDEGDSELMYWGNRLEPVIREEFALRNQVEVETPETLVHPFKSHLRANIDGYIPEWDSVLEIKCSSIMMAKEWGVTETDAIPLFYLTQVAHYVNIANAKDACIAVLVGGNDYREYKYFRNEKLESLVEKAADDFWFAVQNDNAPPLSTIDDIKIMYPTPEKGKSILVDKESNAIIESLASYQKQIKDLLKKEQDCKFHLMNEIKDAECIIDLDERELVSWRANKNGVRSFKLNQKLFKGE